MADARDRILITRPEAEAGSLAARLRASGYVPVLAPLLVVACTKLRAPPGVDAVLVTSGNALAALGGLEQIKLLAVGDATARRARAAGFAEVESAGGDADDLLALATRILPPGASLLLASGQGQGAALAAALRQAGFRVHRRVAYAARPVRRLPEPARASISAGHLRAALFLSADTARTFTRLLPPALAPSLAGVEALAIGQPAADALALLPWARVRVSVEPTLDQVLALL